jgi:hypothetical protein
LINIGNYNGPNVYDFTFIDTLNISIGYNFSVSQIPVLAARYPSNAHIVGEDLQNIVENPIFVENADSSFFAGAATVETEYRFIYYEPYELFTKFPVTFNPPATNFSQWISVYDTTYDLNWQVQSIQLYNQIVDVWIDGYGTLKLPNMELECLRMKRSYSWFNYKEFLYLTRESVLLVVTDVSSSDPDTGYVNADYQLLFLPSPIPGVDEEHALPTQISLEQNYPNPFNPSTRINFVISEFGFTSLKVYDVLGNEVATLVKKELPAGEYRIEFNGEGLKSGVYFYQLKVYPANGGAGSYIETKKMLMLK